MTTLNIDLPDSLIREAKEAGLLDSAEIEDMLRERLRQRAADQLLAAAKQLGDSDLPPMTMDEIQVEVDAVRTQGQQRARGS